MPAPLSPEQLQQIDASLYQGDKIGAIKLYRSFVGGELVDAKQFADARERELRQLDPTRFARKPAGCVGLILFIAALTLVGVCYVFPLHR